jgi:hypothetical protein
MKLFLVLLIVCSGLTFSLLIFSRSAPQTNNIITVSQTSPNQFKEDNHNWELLVLIGVIGFTGIKNRKLLGRKLNAEE